MTVSRAALLGQPRFAVDQSPVRLTARPKVLPLLAYLLLHQDRLRSRVSVVGR